MYTLMLFRDCLIIFLVSVVVDCDLPNSATRRIPRKTKWPELYLVHVARAKHYLLEEIQGSGLIVDIKRDYYGISRDASPLVIRLLIDKHGRVSYTPFIPPNYWTYIQSPEGQRPKKD